MLFFRNNEFPLFNFNMGVFQLVVHRQTIVEDTLNTLLKENNGFKLKMKVFFLISLIYLTKVKFVGEPGIDEGGLTKEFFQLLIKQLFDPNYSMFLEKMVSYCLIILSENYIKLRMARYIGLMV